MKVLRGLGFFFGVWGVMLGVTACNSGDLGYTTPASNLLGQKNPPSSPTPSPSPGSSPSPGKVSVSWNANHEKAVNSAGGGYRVYYSTTSTVNSATPFMNVPWVTGDAPTSATLTGLTSGSLYYISVVAYSTINPTGSTAAQSTVTVK